MGNLNMDRASWYTSQDVEVAFAAGDMAKRMMDRVEGVIQRVIHYG